jgi:hypothetical protein
MDWAKPKAAAAKLALMLFLIWAYLNSWILLLGGFLLVRR